MTIDGLAERALAAGLVQPDPTTCGSSVLVVARMLNDPAYASFLVNGESLVNGRRSTASDQKPGTLADRFRDEVLAMHRRTSRLKAGGGWQLPWPRALGTQPWALARVMTSEAGERPATYDVDTIVPRGRSRSFARIASLAHADHVIPLYVGNRWSPRHVVLVLATDVPSPAEVRIYDPASGRRYPIAADDFAAGRLDVAGWRVPWAVVVPT